jgi:dihydrofolate reductase
MWKTKNPLGKREIAAGRKRFQFQLRWCSMQCIVTEGYAIVSADGMIADRTGHMPDGLKCEADARFFTNGLDSAALIVHGRHSHEQQGAVSDRRRRIIVSDRRAGFFAHPEIPNAWVWNPVSMAFAEACAKVDVRGGKIAVTGGGGVFGLFLKIGFDAFHLSRAGKLVLPGGRAVFPEVPAKTPEQLLSAHGLNPGPMQVLDAKADVTLVSWRR